MKKLLIAAVASTAFVATPALADSENTVIYANVPLVCDITAPANNGSINLAQGSQTQLGQVSAQCNNAAGFTASLSSLNGFKLKDQNNAANGTTYAYTLSVAGLGTVSSNETLNINPGPSQTINPLGLNVAVNMGARAGLAYAGTYQDTLTWTITAN